MTPLAFKAIFAALALLVPGGIAVGYVANEQMNEDASIGANAAQERFGGDIVEAFTADVAPEVLAGSLDLRAFAGNVFVATWERAAYEVTVLTLPPSGGQRLGDAEVVVEFADAGAKAGTLDLSLVVRESGNADVTVNENGAGRYAVVAFVPDLLFENVFACSGGANGFSIDVPLPLVGGESRGERGCVDGVPVNLNLQAARDGDAESLDVPFAVENLRAKGLNLFTQYGDLALTNVDAEKVALATQYGSIVANGATAKALDAFTQYGEIDLVATDAAALSAFTQYGDVRLETSVLGEAKADLGSQYGSVAVLVPGSEDHGYAIEAATQYGDIRIVLPDIESEDAEDESGVAAPAAPAAPAALGRLPALATLPAAKAGPHSEHGGDHASVETKDLASREHVLTLSAHTQYGDVVVGDLLMKGKAKVAEDGDA